MTDSREIDVPELVATVYRSLGEMTVAPILSATVVAAAWSGFQAGRWGGAMTVAFNEASVQRTIAASDVAQASRDIASDRATFSTFVFALASGEETP